MTSSVSSLNPHAVSYIPLSKRVVEDIKNNSFLEETTKTAGISNTVLSAFPEAQGQCQKSTYDLHESESFPSSGNFSSKSHPAAHGSSSQNPTGLSDNQISSAMEFEMDMDYLERSFPNLSERFILDIYLENDGDLESAVDMLNHVEFYAFENPENVPKTREIGEVAEPGATTESGSLKQKNVTDEATTTSTS